MQGDTEPGREGTAEPRHEETVELRHEEMVVQVQPHASHVIVEHSFVL